MVYSLFHCSLLLALCPLLDSFNPRSLPHHHTLHATLPCTAGSFKSRSSLRYHTLLVTLPRSAGSSTTRSAPHHHTLHITQSLAPCHPLMPHRLFQILLLTSPPHAPRHPPTLQNPPHYPLFCNPKNHGRRCEEA